MDAIEIKVINGISIFWDRLYHLFYYWNNGRKVKNRNIIVLINKIEKL